MQRAASECALSSEGLKKEVMEGRREKSQLEALSHVVRQMNASLQAGRSIDKQVVKDSRSLFKALDKDGNGSLSREEIARGLKRLDVVMEAALFDLLLDTMDLNQDGLIDMAEFIRCLSPTTQRRRSETPTMGKVLSDKSDASTSVPVGKLLSDASTMAEGAEDLQQRVAQLEQEVAQLRGNAIEDPCGNANASSEGSARRVPLRSQVPASPPLVTRLLVVQCAPVPHGLPLQQTWSAPHPRARVLPHSRTSSTPSEPYAA